MCWKVACLSEELYEQWCECSGCGRQSAGCAPQNVWRGQQIWPWWITQIFMSACLCLSIDEPVANQTASFRNCKVWLWFECCIISYLRTRWTCVHMLADASGRDGLYSSSMSKTTGLGLFWGVQISSIVKTSLVILWGRRFSLKHRRNKTPLPFPLQDAISNLCILTWELIKCRALASWFLWYTWRHLSVSTPPVSVFFSPAERLYWLVTVLRG